MRVAIVACIHGNRTAFQAVLADLRRMAPAVILHGGGWADCGSSPAAFVGQIRDLGWLGVAGNPDEPKNGSSSPLTAAGPHVYAVAGCMAQLPIGRSAEQLRGTMKLGLPPCSGVPNRRV